MWQDDSGIMDKEPDSDCDQNDAEKLLQNMQPCWSEEPLNGRCAPEHKIYDDHIHKERDENIDWCGIPP